MKNKRQPLYAEGFADLMRSIDVGHLKEESFPITGASRLIGVPYRCVKLDTLFL